MPNDDLALETLLNVMPTVAPSLNISLLRSCYDLQKKHQFDHDRASSTQAMDRLIDAEVAKLVSKEDVKRSQS
jgi:hypothetical protein